MTIALRRQPEAAGRRERAVVRAVMLMMWPLAAAASSLRALSTSVPFYEVSVSPSFTGSDHLLSPVYLGLFVQRGCSILHAVGAGRAAPRACAAARG